MPARLSIRCGRGSCSDGSNSVVATSGRITKVRRKAKCCPLGVLPSVALTECRVQSAGRPSAARIPRQIDGCAVPTPQLAVELGVWVKKWERDHPDLATGEAGKQREGAGARRNERGQLCGNEAVGAVVILHERTQLLDPDGEGVPETTIRSVLKSRWQTTELRTADMLVQAIERADLFHDGTLTVIPNPNASREARAECCGGSNGQQSMNGSLT